MSRRTHRLLLWAAATDKTFSFLEADEDGRAIWAGKCIHCKRHISLTAEGRQLVGATLEHILPRHHGGRDDLMNLAVACVGCNTQKGKRVDHLAATDPRFTKVLDTLRKRRAERYRPAPPHFSVSASTLDPSPESETELR